jgi:dolichyl-phosphate-mannose-protein mannosyltransferase
LTAATARARAGSLALVRAVPTWAWLTAIVAVSASIRFALAQRMPAPWIMVDELIYSELAKSFAASGHFLIRDQPASAYGFVYPIVIAPAFRLFASIPDAHRAAQAINSLVMSLAAVPAYFLARRVIRPPLALFAAVLTVAVPSLVYTGTLMTENAFYPIFLCVALLLVLTLERPTAWRQLGLLALCVLAYETRQQALALFPAVLTAPLLLGPRRAFSRFRVLYGTVAGVVLAALVVQAARGVSPLALLGAYETTGNRSYSIPTVAKWLLWHLSELDLYLGVVPLAAFVLLALEWRRLGPRERAFMAGAASLSAWLVVEVAAFATIPTVQRIEERNVFYVAPLFLIALLLWVARGAPRVRPWAPAVALGAALLIGALPFSHFIGVQATADTLALLPWWNLQEHVITLAQVRPVATLCAIGAAVLFLVVPARWALVLPALVLVYFAAIARPIESRTTFASRGALFQGIRSVPRDWIDRVAGRHGDVAAIWTGKTDVHVIWENEFFNRSVGPVYDTGEAIPGGLPSTAVTVGRDGFLRDAQGRLIRHRFVLVDGSLDLNGVKRASDNGGTIPLGVNLWELNRPVRSLTRVDGLYLNDTWSGPSVTYRRFECRGGSVRVALLGDVHLFSRPQTVRAEGVVKRVVPGVPATMTVPLNRCTARFTVTPTKVPGPQDPRRLGIHFLSFEYLPRSR